MPPYDPILVGKILSICNSIVRADRSRKFHSMSMLPEHLLPGRLPREIRKNLTLEQAAELVSELDAVGAKATALGTGK